MLRHIICRIQKLVFDSFSYPDGPGREIQREVFARSSLAKVSALPSSWPGNGISKVLKTVGAMSRIVGSEDSSGRLERKMPAVSLGSEAQWSPLHFFMLATTMPAGMAPSEVCHDVR